MVVPSPIPRRVKTPSWLDLRLVLGVVLVLGSVAAGAAVVAGAGHSDPILVAKRDLAAGTVLSAGDLSTASARVPDRARYLGPQTQVVGEQVNRAVSRGELLPANAIGTPPALTTVTITFADGAAPDLAPGRRIEVWLSTRSCGSVVLVADAPVQHVAEAGGGSFTSGGGQNVTLSLPPRLAARVVTALSMDGASIRAGVLSGPSQPDASASLPPLGSCADTPP